MDMSVSVFLNKYLSLALLVPILGLSCMQRIQSEEVKKFQ